MIRSFFRKASLLAGVEVIARLKGLVIIPLLTHRFHAVGYGVWAQVGVLVALFAPLITLGTDAGIVRYLPGTDRAERNRHFAGWLIAMAAVAVVVCALVALLRNQLAVVAFGEAGEYARFIPLAAASILTTIFLNFSRTWLRLENHAVGLSAITLGQAFLSTLALLAMFLLGQGLYQLVLYSLLADALLGLVMLLWIVSRTGFVRPNFSLLPRLLRYGAVLLPAGYAIWALNWADRVFLVHYTDLRAVGLYSLAYSLGYLLIQVVVNPIWVMFPNVAAASWNEGKRADVQRLFESTAGVMLAIILPAIAGSAVLGDALLRALAPADFGHAGPVLPLVLGGYLCFMLAAFYEVTFGLIDRQVLGLLTVAVACVLNLVLNLTLIPRFSYIGAAVATCLAFVVQLALAALIARRLHLLRTPLGRPLRMVAASVVMALVLLPLRGAFGDHGVLLLLVGTLVGAAVYGGLCVLFGVARPVVLKRELGRLVRRVPADEVSELPVV
jgi:O-antigen/teichoic acid export membrane protein